MFVEFPGCDVSIFELSRDRGSNQELESQREYHTWIPEERLCSTLRRRRGSCGSLNVECVLLNR